MSETPTDCAGCGKPTDHQSGICGWCYAKAAFLPESLPVPAPAEQAETPKPCRVCGGSGFVAQKRTIDDGWGEVDSCPECDRQDELAALRAEVARLTADKAQTIAEFDQAIRDGRITVHVESWKSRAEQAEAENARLKAERDEAEEKYIVANRYADTLIESKNRHLSEVARLQADRDTLRQQIEAERESLRAEKARELRENLVHPHYSEGFDAALAWVLALLGERREEPTQ